MRGSAWSAFLILPSMMVDCCCCLLAARRCGSLAGSIATRMMGCRGDGVVKELGWWVVSKVTGGRGR